MRLQWDILTTREREVVEHVLAGRSNKWIAISFSVSESTISTHLKRAMTKIGVASKPRLVVVGHARAGRKVDPAAFGAPLTPAERAVFELVLVGKSNSEIARVRGTSERTVANQVSSIFRKAGVCSRVELASRVSRYRAVSPLAARDAA